MQVMALLIRLKARLHRQRRYKLILDYGSQNALYNLLEIEKMSESDLKGSRI